MNFFNHADLIPRLIAIAFFVITMTAVPKANATPEVYENYWGSKRADLMFHTDGEGYQPAPVLETDVKISITGPVARVIVRQKFHNPAQDWAEGIYVFPLTTGSAVDHMRLIVDGRVIEGQIHEKQVAQRKYEKAKREGKRASLVRQERPNIFTTKVANIPPGGEIDVEIEYQQSVLIDSGSYSFRFPMVVGPRYIPGTASQSQASGGTGWSRDTDVVKDASRITPPVQHPAKGLINPVRISVDLAPGFDPDNIESKYHPIKINNAGDGRYHLTLASSKTPANRDFVLAWRPSTATNPQTSLFTEQIDSDFYSLLVVTPPPANNEMNTISQREVVFLIDHSGSMAGPSIRQAKSALLMVIDRLRPDDTFNIIGFNHMAHPLFGRPVQASFDNKNRAKHYIQSMQANGGTEMYSALNLALDNSADSGGRLRQVIFLTDGAVGDESRLFNLIKTNLGTARLFPIGIGSAPNSHLLQKAAQFGRGDFTYIGNVTEVQKKMTALFRKIEAPALTDIKVTLDGVEPDSEMYPTIIPDLYMGRPVIVAVKTKSAPGNATITGRSGLETWRTTIDTPQAVSKSGVNVLWARRKIESLLDTMRQPSSPEETKLLRQLVVDTSIQHHMVSKFTSLVAVDMTPVRPVEEQVTPHNIKTNMPHGWQHGKVFGSARTAHAPMAFAMARTATSAREDIMIGILMLLGAVVLWRMKECTGQK